MTDSVGEPLSADELREAKKEAKQRIIDKSPPGWKDASKKQNPEGDYLVWHETLQEGRRRGVDILLVTGDVKEDWWRKEHGEVKGPLPELSHEMRTIANVRLFMLRPGSLLVHAANTLGVSITERSVEDTQRVEKENRRGDEATLKFGLTDDNWDELADVALDYLIERAKLSSQTTYNDFFDALGERVDSEVDFRGAGKQAAAGHLLNLTVERNFPETGFLITALITHQKTNAPGAGFYRLAEDLGMLPGRAAPHTKQEFWKEQVEEVFAYYTGEM